MAETYDTLAASEKAKATWFCRVELWGIPYKRAGNGATAPAISLVSHMPTAATYASTAGFINTLAGVNITPDRVNPTTGATITGSCSVSFGDFVDTQKWYASDASDYYFASVFAGRKAARVGSLTSDLSRTATSMSFAGAVTDGNVYWIGSEAILADSTTSGTGGAPGTATIIRGPASAQTEAHPASITGHAHADDIYDRPRIFRGLLMAVYFNYDHADLSQSSEVGPRLYVVNSAPTWSVQGGAYHWTIKGDSYAVMLRRQAGRGAYAGKIENYSFNPLRPPGVPTVVIYSTGSADYPRPAFHAVDDRVWLDIDDEAMEVEVATSSTTGRTTAVVVSRGGMGTELTGDDIVARKASVREFIPTDTTIAQPRIGPIAYDAGYDIAALAASDHPVDALLCRMLSGRAWASGSFVGASSNATLASGNNSYDTLPPPHGLAIPVARVDIATFETLRALTFDARFPHFRLGREGPEALSEWWERQCAPLVGIAYVQNASGQITGVLFDDAYPLSSSVSITHADILLPYPGQEGAKEEALGLLQVKYRARDGSPGRLDEASILISELFPHEVKTREIDSDGASDETLGFLAERLQTVLSREEFPTPRRKLSLSWRFHNRVFAGTKLRITDANSPDVKNGGYGVADEAWLVTSAALRLPVGGRDASVDVDCIRIDDGVGHIGPSGKVTAWDAGTKTLTIEANFYTPTTSPSGTSIPNSDIKGFGDDGAQGGLGVLVEFWDADGDTKTTNRLEVTTISYSGRTMVLDAAPSSTPQVGWIVVLAQMTNSVAAEVAAETVSDEQDDYIYWANSEPSARYIDTNVPAYRWGQ